MNTRRRLFLGSIVAVVAVGMMTLPSFAAKPVNKTFTMTVAPASVAAGTTGQPFDVTIKNTTPGNSNISSFSVNVPSQFSDVSAALLASGSTNPNSNAVVSVSGSVVSVTNLDPIKRDQVAAVRITVDVADSCATSNSGAWTATAWTGSALNGDPFNLTNVTGSPTSITASCSLAFVAGQTPTGAQSGTTITAADGTDVQVAVLNGSTVDTSFIGTVTLVKASGPADPTGLTGNVATVGATDDGIASFPNLTITKIGTYTLKAQSAGYTDSAASPEFTIYEEGITCGEEAQVDDESGTSVTFERTDDVGSENCVVVPYTLIVNGDDEVRLLKDEATVRNEDATFILTITWGAPAGSYPDFGETTFDLDGDNTTVDDIFTPDECDVVGGQPQYPNNPDGADYWPDGDADEPWCVAEVLVQPSGTDFFVTETFNGGGDPLIKRS